MIKDKVIGILLLLLIFSCRTEKKEETKAFETNPECVQIVLFHMAQRCTSCNAVEKETKKILEEVYKDELDAGKIKFLSFNFQSENGKKAASQLNVTGQSLIIVKGNNTIDLSGPAFLFAHPHPERYRDALTGELEKYLK